MRDTISNILDLYNATISNGQSLSETIDLGGLRLFGLVMPSAWTSANITLQTSADGTNWNNIYDRTGTEYSIAAAASRTIYLAPADLSSFARLRLRSGTTATPVNQGANRTIGLILRMV